jgi:hypothetical protein
MKKLLLLTSFFIFLVGVMQVSAQRFLTQTFSGVNVTSNVIYANNMSVLTGTPTPTDLKMDVYTPAGDNCTNRPLVIYLHAGTFLPIIYNKACVGTKTDSSIVEECTQFAKKGYVAVAMDYRLGWNANAIGVDPDVTLGTLFQAVYRAIQDAKCCVRYFKANVQSGGNTYGVDTTRISLGGVGSGAIVALNYVALQDTLQLWMPKFLSGTDNATYGFQAGYPYVNWHLLGDFEGYGGIPQLNNPNNNPGHTTNVQMLYSIYGEIGDSTWINTNYPPVVALHPMTPPLGGGPYHWGTIYAGNTGIPVLPDVSGPHQYICKFDANGVNYILSAGTFTDPYSVRANAINSGCEALFPFETVGQQEDLWDWYSYPALSAFAPFIGATQGQVDTAYGLSIQNNPNMSKSQALAYIDTIQNYIAPRAYLALDLTSWSCTPLGINQVKDAADFVSVFPNPSSGNFTINSSLPAGSISSIEITDVSGRIVKAISSPSNSITVDRKTMADGMYYVKVRSASGDAVKKIILQ